MEHLVARFRSAGMEVVSPTEMERDEECGLFLESYARAMYRDTGKPPEVVANTANVLGSHLYYMCNFELNRRKLFWVEESLAWMLVNTTLDVQGSHVRLPFPCCAFVFKDPTSLEMAGDMIRLDPEVSHLVPRVMTIYVMELPAERPRHGIALAICIDDLSEHEWPYPLVRYLYFGDEDDLETVLESHMPDVPGEEHDPIFDTVEVKRIVHLALNAVLYATTAHLDAMILESPLKDLKSQIQGKSPSNQQRLLNRLDRRSRKSSAESVYYLPGKIEISRLRELQKAQRSEKGRAIFKKFMVRGHWRRANPSWHDQNLRWIEPYWKGPELATIIEREYRMKP